MTGTQSDGSGGGDHEVVAAAPVTADDGPRTASEIRADLSGRTRQILEATREAPDPEAIAWEKAVVHECRYLMRLLSTRRRSEGEMRQRLAEREVPADIAHEVMARIIRADLVDDAAFAHEWVQQRRSLRALGDEALRRELSRRRVDAPLIDAALETGESDEEVRCRELVRSRIGVRDRERLRTERDGAHRRRLSRRLDALLTRKGYPGSLAVHVIAGELREASHDPES
ncbi:regulatory protein RecX [Brachybacterium alimentarium]|uniref:regulatory protein RecX n=1 Tax=Brachybacterium alimentarium TaxID=47845 RepID=UPI000DF19B9F|nr:regulatory protein RecX [Brachybacterium alimentarium]RCS76039.1 regulatory protein RecX [Brachybacterium alimentarium]RCS80442.1 regulatory protein RecX [Brachybacterium alimentarium]RCS85800.1 regulatory protein RecX [Brachybacterium alimentarium]